MGVMFAYGSNLSIWQMKHRCPAAKPIGRLALRNWRLVFRSVADCVYEKGAVCYGGVWRITPECEAELDRREGIAKGSYRKEYIPIKKLADGTDRMLLYCMNSDGIMAPTFEYLDLILEGYRDFEMSEAAFEELNDAVHHAQVWHNPSHLERQRHKRKGKPALATPFRAVRSERQRKLAAQQEG